MLGLSLGLWRLRRPSAGGAVPVNSLAPAVSGTTNVGETLTTTNGNWTNSPTSYAYTWYRDGVPIGGATSSTYLLVADDEGALIYARVVASNAAGSGASKDSNTVGPIRQEVIGEFLDLYAGGSLELYAGGNLELYAAVVALALYSGGFLELYSGGYHELYNTSANALTYGGEALTYLGEQVTYTG